jgi:hypothetical protein
MSTKVKAIRYFEPMYEYASDRFGAATCGPTNEEISEIWLKMIDAADKGDYDARRFLNTFAPWASEVIWLRSH